MAGRGRGAKPPTMGDSSSSFMNERNPRGVLNEVRSPSSASSGIDEDVRRLPVRGNPRNSLGQRPNWMKTFQFDLSASTDERSSKQWGDDEASSNEDAERIGCRANKRPRYTPHSADSRGTSQSSTTYIDGNSESGSGREHEISTKLWTTQNLFHDAITGLVRERLTPLEEGRHGPTPEPGSTPQRPPLPEVTDSEDSHSPAPPAAGSANSDGLPLETDPESPHVSPSVRNGIPKHRQNAKSEDTKMSGT